MDEVSERQVPFFKSEKGLALLALLLMSVALWIVWQISEVHFSLVGNSDSLGKNYGAVVWIDTGQCPVSIDDERVKTGDEVKNETLQPLLWECIRGIRKVAGNKLGSASLPHEWRSDERLPATSASMRVLYSIDYPIPYWPEEGLGLWSIAITGAGHNAAVFLNGKLLGWSGSFEQPVARNHSRPMLFPIPDGFLKEGDNRFDIYTVSDSAREGFLGEAFIAPSELLNPAYQVYYFFRFTAAQVITLAMLVLSGFMCVLWFYRRRDVEYGLFALMGVFWSLHTLNQFVVDIPLSTLHWNWLIQSSYAGLFVCSILFIHRFLQQKHVRAERILLAAVLILVAVLWLLPQSWFYPLVQYFWEPLVLLGAFYVLVTTLLKIRETPGIELSALATAVAIIFLLMVHDELMSWGVLPVYEGRLLHFGAPFLLLAFTWILLRRFVESLNSAEQYNADLRLLNQQLESRVEEKSRRIAQSYEMIRQLGQEQVVQQERSRIMRDMHDGIGVYLTSMLRQLEHEPLDRQHLQDSAHNALNDLRLMIDSLGSASTDVPAMLGMFRTRISRLVEACQVELEWEVAELPPLDDFGPERALNLLRILQEAVTNALKHSGATRIKLSADVETIGETQSHITIRVQDNGKGFVLSNMPGNGLKNMQHRARKIRADFTIDTQPQGSCITVKLAVTTPSSEVVALPQNENRATADSDNRGL
ncbi:MAG: 7TM diverse intracellular signaling domain-containing protein [Thiolinea sp.]